MYPLKMTPEIKYLIWGGSRLKEVYHKNCTGDNAGESWEVSTHPAGLSRIANGPLAGQTLADAIASHPAQIAPADFPFLFKIIDANGDLSIQVHPDDAYARAHENSPRGKTELWYIIDAAEGAKIGYGWKHDMTPEAVRAAVENGTLEQDINYLPVHAGEAYFIPAGTVHCLCSGLLVAEIQQNSNVTYRLYDYNRKDAEGNGRELHLDKSLDVADLRSAAAAKPTGGDNAVLAKCPYFTAETIRTNEYRGNTNGAFELFFFLSGNGFVDGGDEHCSFTAGDTFLLPSSLGEYRITGDFTAMRCVE